MSNEYLNNKSFEGIISRFQQAKRDRAKYELIIEEIAATKQRVAKRKDDFQPFGWKECEKKFDAIMLNFQEAQKELAYAFYTLSENIVRYAKFHLIDVDDAIQEGVMICFEKVDRFDPNYRGKNGQKAKAFNYMTTCTLNHFRQLYRSARNYNELKRKYFDFQQRQSGFIPNNTGKIDTFQQSFQNYQ